MEKGHYRVFILRYLSGKARCNAREVWTKMAIEEKLRKLRELGYEVADVPGIRPKTGERVLYVNGQDIDEQFVDQLIGGADFHQVQYRRNKWLNSL
jgi:hypothetical protein